MEGRMLLVDERGNKYLVQRGQKLETDIGVFEIPGEVVAGQALRSHLSRLGTLLEPSIRDYVEKMERPTRILHYEDVGYVLAYSGLREGSFVVEAGTGSGCTALYFSQAVGSRGRVLSFERRPDIHSVAGRNLAGFGCQNVDLVCGDVRDGEEDISADLFFLDLESPSDYVELAASSLRPGGTVAAYAPFMEQGVECLRKLNKLGAGEARMTEIVRRDYETLPSGTRPRPTQTVHTGYLVFGRASGPEWQGSHAD